MIHYDHVGVPLETVLQDELWLEQAICGFRSWLADHVGVCLKIGYPNLTDSSSFVCSCQMIEHIVFLDWNKLIQVYLIPPT